MINTQPRSLYNLQARNFIINQIRMTAKDYCLQHYPDAKIKRCQSGFKRGIEYRLTYNIISHTQHDQIIATSISSAWVALKNLTETTK